MADRSTSRKDKSRKPQQSPRGTGGSGAGASVGEAQRKSEETTSSEKRPAMSAAVTLRLGIPFIVLALLRGAASFFPEARLWGLNYLAYLPSWAVLTTVAAALLCATPVLFGWYHRTASALMRDQAKAPRMLFLLVLLIAAVVAFWQLRMETYFLGDGAVYLAEIYRFTIGSSFAHDVLYSTGSAPLTGQIIVMAAEAVRDSFAAAWPSLAFTQAPFWLIGIAAGAIYIIAAVFAVQSLFRDSAMRFGMLMLFLFTPASLFFFGYVEYYTLFFVAALGYFSTLTLSLRGRLSPIWPIVLFVVLSALHIMGLVALPSLLLLIALRFGGETLRRWVRPATVFGGVAAVLLAGMGFYFASGIAWNGSRIVLALQPFGLEGAIQQYTLLSGWHLADVLNMIFLLAAPILPLVFVKGLPAKLRDPEVLVTLVNLLFFSFLLFFGYTCFGMARDWDVNTVWVLPLLFFIAALIRDERAEAMRYRMFLAAGAAMTAVIPWIAVNVTTETSVSRFRDVMALDDHHVTGDFALNGYEHLRKYYRSIDDTDGMLWAVEKKIEMVGYPRDYRDYTEIAIKRPESMLVRNGMDKLIGSLRQRIETLAARDLDTVYAGHRDEFIERYYDLILESSFRKGKPGFTSSFIDDQLRWLEPHVANDPLYQLLVRRVTTGSNDGIPIELVRQAGRRLYASPTMALGIAELLVNNSFLDEAIDVLQRTLTRNPTTPLLALYLGKAELMVQPQRVDSAERHLRYALRNPESILPDDPGGREQLLQWTRDVLARIEQSRSSG